MTVGNSSSEVSSTPGNALPQVSEYCLLVLKETRFLLLDVSWLFELYKSGKDEPDGTLRYLTSLMKFEDFLDQTLSSQDTSFVYEMIQPALDDNTLSDQMHTDVCCLAEKLYLDVHTKVCDSLVGSGLLPDDDPGHDHLRLVGFFGLTAIISIGDIPLPTYPTFEEAYGHFGVTKWRDSIRRIPVLETFVPFIQGQCAEYSSF